MDLPTVGGAPECPVKGCKVQAAMRTAIRVYLLHIHDRDTVIILEESNLPHPQCPWCYMLVQWKSLDTLPNIPFRVSKSPYIHSGSVDATRP